jgi:hypothetical protein
MCRIALMALLLLASWPAVATASEATKSRTASASGADMAHVARKVAKRSAARGRPIILGIAY